MMTRSELDEARGLIHDVGLGAEAADAAAVEELAATSGRLLAELERMRMLGSAPEQQAAHAQLLGDARAALAAARRGEDPEPFLEHAVKPYGELPRAGARPEQVAADAAYHAAAVMA